MLTESLEKIQHFGGSGFVPICSADAVVECFSMGMSGPPCTMQVGQYYLALTCASAYENFHYYRLL